MIIKELAFSTFTKIFKGHDDMLVGIGFTKHGTVDVLLTPNARWHVTRNPESGQVCIMSEESEEYKEHIIILESEDFDEITIC